MRCSWSTLWRPQKSDTGNSDKEENSGYLWPSRSAVHGSPLRWTQKCTCSILIKMIYNTCIINLLFENAKEIQDLTTFSHNWVLILKKKKNVLISVFSAYILNSFRNLLQRHLLIFRREECENIAFSLTKCKHTRLYRVLIVIKLLRVASLRLVKWRAN